jgi:hypothetical protein
MTGTPHLRLVRQRLDAKICIPMSTELRRQLEQEARAAGYRSLSGYVRDHKLGAPRCAPPGRHADGA